jgi:hypothetical protein
MPKNHSTKKLHLDHNCVVDMIYIRKREREYLVNRQAIPAWVTFSLWALAKGIRIQLTESLSTESKYVTARIRDFKKNKERVYVLRFSDHASPRDDFDFQIGVNFSPLQNVIDWFDGILEECRMNIETDEMLDYQKLKNMHEHPLRIDEIEESGKTKWMIVCETCQLRSDITNKKKGAFRSWAGGKRISTISTTKENRK